MGVHGSYAHKLDRKGRMVLPARFRDHLGDRVVATIRINRWRSISVYPVVQWSAYLSQLDEQAAKGGKALDVRRIVLASAHELEVDSTGRILVPSPLRTYAGIDQDVSVNGNGELIEIWNLSTWGEYMKEILEGADEQTEGMRRI